MAECEVVIVAAKGQIRDVLHQVFLGSGYTCQVVSNGEEGLAALRSHRASIVLAELAMPGMAGIEFLRQVRSTDVDIAVIVLADVFDVKTRTECLQAGADACIIRNPLNVGDLLTAAERALEARSRTPPTPAPVSRHLADDGETGEITPEQFLDIFEYNSRDPEMSDPQFTVGIPIIRAWMDLRSRQTISQADLDGLFNDFTAAAIAGIEGMRLYDLWLYVLRWGQGLGLSVPDQHPWYRR